jgi:Fur family transcriptional regulator, ferric uptake regulator
MPAPEVSGDDQLRMLLEAAGLRCNQARRQLAGRLRSEARPMSAEDLRLAEPSLPYSSIYRTLAALIQAGVVRRMAGIDGNARFELTEAVSGEHHHHHLACADCGAMETLVLPAGVENGLKRAAAAVRRSGRFTVESHHVELIGRCAACAARLRRR